MTSRNGDWNESVPFGLRLLGGVQRKSQSAVKACLEDGAIRHEKNGRYIIKRGGRQHSFVRDDWVSKINDLLGQLETLTESGPFPYEGCRRLQTDVPERHDGLIPDLDTYLSEFAGYRSWGKRILEWSDERIDTVEGRLHQSFFDRFPAYAGLKPLIGSSTMSDVRNALRNADQTRALLVALLSAVRNARAGIDE